MNRNIIYIIVALLGLFVAANGYAQTKYSGIIADSTAYIVISQPSEITKNAKLIDNDLSRFPYLKIADTLLLLSTDTVKDVIAFTLPEEMYDCEDLFFIDTIIIGKVGDRIKQYDGEKVSTIMIMPDDNYDIYPADFGYIYIVRHDADTSSVILLELSTVRYVTLFKTPFHIDNLVGDGFECYVSAGIMMFYFTEKEYLPVIVGESTIQSIATYEGGVFFSTQNACYFMGEKAQSYPFLLGNIKQLMLIDNRLYLLFNNGLLSVIDNADGYRRLLEEAVKEINTEEK